MPEEGRRAAETGHRLLSPKAALAITNSVIGAVLGTAALVYIAQNMGPSVLGMLGYAMVSIGLLSFLSDFGVGSVHVLQVKSCKDVGKCIGAYATIRLVLLAVFSIVTLILIQLWKDGLVGGRMPSSSGEVETLVDSMYVFLVYYVLLGVSQIATHTFDALDAPAKAFAPSLLELIVRVSFILYVATTLLGTGRQGPVLLSFAYGAGMISATLLASVMMRKYRVSRPDRAILMNYIRSLLPVFTVSMIIILDMYMDKAIVGYFWGETELGLYFGVQKMSIFVGVFSLSVATMILPSVTTYFIRKDIGASWDVVSQAERYVSLIVIPTAAFYLMWGSDILRVFLGNAFTRSVNTMDLLVISGAVLAVALPLRSAIAGVGKPGTLFKIGVGGTVMQFVLLLLFVPDSFMGFRTLALKGQGAALVLLISSIYYFFVLRYMAWRTAKILPNARSFKHLLSAVVMIGSMYIVNWVFEPSINWLWLIVLAVVGCASYGASAYFLDELEFSDYKYFRELLNPQDTFQYVLNELIGKRSQ
jgi:O-antigen/teichoic acid export membrane protein